MLLRKRFFLTDQAVRLPTLLHRREKHGTESLSQVASQICHGFCPGSGFLWLVAVRDGCQSREWGVSQCLTPVDGDTSKPLGATSTLPSGSVPTTKSGTLRNRKRTKNACARPTKSAVHAATRGVDMKLNHYEAERYRLAQKIVLALDLFWKTVLRWFQK